MFEWRQFLRGLCIQLRERSFQVREIERIACAIDVLERIEQLLPGVCRIVVLPVDHDPLNLPSNANWLIGTRVLTTSRSCSAGGRSALSPMRPTAIAAMIE